MEVVPLTPDLEAAWERFVGASPGATVAHLLGWRNVVTRTYGHRPQHLVARDAGAVAGVLPLFLIRSRLFGRFLVTAPYLSHGGPLTRDDAVTGALVAAAKEIVARERARYLEIRACRRVGHGLLPKDKFATYLLGLGDDPDVVWQRLEGRARKAVRKALRSDLAVERGAHLLDALDLVLGRHMHELGTPFHRAAFYRHVLEELPEHAEILMVSRAGRHLGGLLLATCRDTVLPLYGGVLSDERDASPMSLLLWETIRWACARGFRYVDLGRSERDSGGALFKRQWGAEAVPMFYEYHLREGTPMPDMYPTNPKLRLAVATWKRLPSFVTRALGPSIIRDIP